jgi:hypothetical protein
MNGTTDMGQSHKVVFAYNLSMQMSGRQGPKIMGMNCTDILKSVKMQQREDFSFTQN